MIKERSRDLGQIYGDDNINNVFSHRQARWRPFKKLVPDTFHTIGCIQRASKCQLFGSLVTTYHNYFERKHALRVIIYKKKKTICDYKHLEE